MSPWPALIAVLASDPTLSQEMLEKQVRVLRDDNARLGHAIDDLAAAAGIGAADHATRLSIFHGYTMVLIVAFLVTLLTTPLMRRLAVAHGVIDRPNEARKVHRMPIAYLGGAAVFLGIMAGIFYSYFGHKFPELLGFHSTKFLNDDGQTAPVPLSITLGITVIMLIGLLDDVTGISPRVKVGGQLLAAAALAIDDVGVKLAAGFLEPIGKLFGNPALTWHIPLPFTIPFSDASSIEFNLIYWTGTAVIAVAVLGLCNAANLIDGLDGLLSGTTAISAAGLLILALGLALVDDGPRDAQRIILCLALLGACLGFLPHNFNPANIFLGDTGSLLLGFCTCVIILTLGDTGKTHLVTAGLIIFALPVIDMTLAIIRRRMAGRSVSTADDQHLHHMLKRAVGVKGAVFVLYAIVASFAALGIAMSMFRARSIYVIALVLASFIGVIAIKIARRRHIEEQAAAFDARPEPQPAPRAELQTNGATPAPAATPARS